MAVKPPSCRVSIDQMICDFRINSKRSFPLSSIGIGLMRKSNFFLLYLSLNFLILLCLAVHSFFRTTYADEFLKENNQLVKKLELTDLCIFTEASYTRHLSQADINTPFQDNPTGLEHFPSGSFLLPPQVLKKPHGKIN